MKIPGKQSLFLIAIVAAGIVAGCLIVLLVPKPVPPERILIAVDKEGRVLKIDSDGTVLGGNPEEQELINEIISEVIKRETKKAERLAGQESNAAE